MMTFGRKVDRTFGRRRSPREPVVLVAAAVTLDHSQSVTIEDVCSTGAKLRGRGLPGNGRQMLVRVGDVELLATVAWSANGECGIAFESALDEFAVQQLKDEGEIARILGVR